MTRPDELRTPGLLIRPIIDFLDGHQSKFGVGVTIGHGLIEKWTTSSSPHIAVFDDSGPMKWPIVTEPQLRITVWADGYDEARRICGLCLGLVLTHRIPGIAQVLPGASLLDSRDSRTGGQMVSFTARTRIRTVPA